jgi:hypothetical protein
VSAFLLTAGAGIPLHWLQNGLNLRAVVDENGVSEIRGFSRACLKQLVQLQKPEKPQ